MSVLDLLVRTALHVKIFPGITCADVKQVLQERTVTQVSYSALFLISIPFLQTIYPFRIMSYMQFRITNFYKYLQKDSISLILHLKT